MGSVCWVKVVNGKRRRSTTPSMPQTRREALERARKVRSDNQRKESLTKFCRAVTEKVNERAAQYPVITRSNQRLTIEHSNLKTT